MVKVHLVLSDGVVVNRVLWDGVSPWEPPPGTELAPAEGGADVGWRRSGGIWHPPEPDPEPDPGADAPA